MKKRLCCILVFLGVTLTASPQGLIKLGPRVTYYATQDDLLSTYYAPNDLMFGFQAGVKIWRGIHLFAGVDRLEMVSRTSETGDLARLKVTPFFLTAAYYYDLKKVIPFAGLGYSRVYFREESSISPDPMEGQPPGYHLVIGCGFRFSPRVMVFLSARKTGAVFENQLTADISETIDMGGIQAGLSFFIVLF